MSSSRCDGTHVHASSGETYRWKCVFVVDPPMGAIAFTLNVTAPGMPPREFQETTRYNAARTKPEDALVPAIDKLIDTM